MAISGCEKTQSALPSEPSSGLSVKAMPATETTPSALRRRVSSGDSIYICSTPRVISERAETATTTLGKCRAGLWLSGSCSTTSPSSKDGIRPSLCAASAPMVTGIPRLREARDSSSGRHSLIRGTIQNWSTPQMRANISHRPSTSLSDHRARLASRWIWRDGRGFGSIISGLAMAGIMTGALKRVEVTIRCRTGFLPAGHHF